MARQRDLSYWRRRKTLPFNLGVGEISQSVMASPSVSGGRVPVSRFATPDVRVRSATEKQVEAPLASWSARQERMSFEETQNLRGPNSSAESGGPKNSLFSPCRFTIPIAGSPAPKAI